MLKNGAHIACAHCSIPSVPFAQFDLTKHKRAEAQLLAAGPLVQRGGKERKALVASRDATRAEWGVLPLHIGLSHPPRRPPSGVVAKR